MTTYGTTTRSNRTWTWAAIAFAFVFFITLPLWLRLGGREEYYLHSLANIFTHGMVALGLRLLWRTGLVSFGTAGFIAIGGYIAGYLSRDIGISFWFSLPLGGLAAAAFATVLGIPILRLKSSYFFLISWATGEIIRLSFLYLFKPVFGGWQGFRKIPLPDAIDLFGIVTIDFSQKAHWYYLAFFLLCLTVIIMTRIDYSWIGKTIGALSDAPDLCESLGVATMYYRVFAFATACFFAGVAGAVYGSFNTFLHPESFTIIQSIETVSFVIIGGAATVWGPILGAFVVKGIALGVRGFGAYEVIFSGLMMILVMIFIPEGLTGLPRRIRRYFSRRKVTKDTVIGHGD
jgi:branched-chain amino acid transport system permease protein